MRFGHVVLLSSVALLAAFGGAAYWLSHQEQRQLERTLALETQRLVTAYEVSEANLGHLMVVLANNVAHEGEVVSLLAGANRALLGAMNSGEDLALALSAPNKAMLELVYPRWRQMFDDIGVRQMQFVLPGAISLLRMHAPESFGDSLRDVRPMLEDVERLHRPVSGFEVGRAFSGIRGAVPVEVPGPEGTTVFLGIIEIGVVLDGQIERLSAQTGVGYGILLRPGFVGSITWEDYRIVPGNPADLDQACCHLAAASRDELGTWLSANRIRPVIGERTVHRISEGGKVFQLAYIPLHDYMGKRDQTHEAIGSVAVWHDVTDAVNRAGQTVREHILLLISAWLLTQGVTLLLLRASRREWQLQLDAQTDAVRQLSGEQTQLLDTVAEGIYGVDRHGRATFINPAACTMLDRREDEVLGEDQHALFHHQREDGSPYPSQECPIFLTLNDGKRRVSDEWFFRANGKGFPVQITVTASRSDMGDTAAVVAFHDVTEQRRNAEALLEMASTDPLTGLANRRRFMDELAREIARFRREQQDCGVMMCDLDHFKAINDTHGHAAGDEVLKQVAAVARSVLRTADLLGRIGGEEFAVLLPDSDTVSAAIAAERLREAIAKARIPTAEGEITVTVSIGITMLCSEDTLADHPLARADKALYAAKATGRNRVVGEPPGLMPDFIASTMDG